jgi:hypothetical protein
MPFRSTISSFASQRVHVRGFVLHAAFPEQLEERIVLAMRPLASPVGDRQVERRGGGSSGSATGRSPKTGLPNGAAHGAQVRQSRQHDAPHEFVEQWNRERSVTVTGTPDHALAMSWLRVGPSAVTLRPSSSATSPDRWGPGPNSDIARKPLLERRQAVEAHAEETRQVQRWSTGSPRRHRPTKSARRPLCPRRVFPIPAESTDNLAFPEDALQCGLLDAHPVRVERFRDCDPRGNVRQRAHFREGEEALGV